MSMLSWSADLLCHTFSSGGVLGTQERLAGGASESSDVGRRASHCFTAADTAFWGGGGGAAAIVAADFGGGGGQAGKPRDVDDDRLRHGGVGSRTGAFAGAQTLVELDDCESNC